MIFLSMPAAMSRLLHMKSARETRSHVADFFLDGPDCVDAVNEYVGYNRVKMQCPFLP
jgi:hypothetical protein